ncbi:hypothetical protein CJF32_00010691 [Rutstroemia sp. NJR-2017a WRK4]|nr:hypothetical protein CJF32_00010691 [Rutstroemia sp. NJR-2017a WRK4]
MPFSFVPNDSPQVLNLFSEWLCWCMLWAGTKIYSRLESKPRNTEKRSLSQREEKEEDATSLAFFIITSTVCASITEVNWILPFLTPALYFVTRNDGVDHYVLPGNFLSGRSEHPPDYGFRLISYILVAITTSLLFLPSSTTPTTLGLGLIFLLCQTAIYSRLNSTSTSDDEYRSAKSILPVLENTCCWVVCFLTIILLVSPQEAPILSSLTISAVFRAFLWIAIVFLCNEGHGCTLTLMSTFGLSTIHILVFASPVQAALSCSCSLLLLNQIISSLPRSCSSRRLIILFALFPIMTLIFRFNFSETDNLTEIVSGIKEMFSMGRSCRTTITKNVVQGVMDEPSRLVAEFGAREEPNSWLQFITRIFSPAEKSCSGVGVGFVDLR